MRHVWRLLRSWPAAWSGRTTNAPTHRRPWRSRNCRLEDQPAGGRRGQGRLVVGYHDPELDRLERMVEVSNQTVKQFEAEYRNAVALVAEARAGLFPTVALSPGVTRNGSGGVGGRVSSLSSGSSTGGSGRSGTQYTISGTVDRGTSTSGAASAGRWKAAPPPPRSARPIWRMPSCRRRRRWPPTISTCAPRIRWPNC